MTTPITNVAASELASQRNGCDLIVSVPAGHRLDKLVAAFVEIARTAAAAVETAMVSTDATSSDPARRRT
jgi:hypothetical protein